MGLFDYNSNEIGVKAARREASGLNKKSYSHRISTQKERVGQQQASPNKGTRQPAREKYH
jgi:hypothetical protein